MRRLLALPLFFALFSTACARNVYSVPAPLSPAPARAASPALTQGQPVSSAETVDYLLARGLEIPVAGATLRQVHDSFDEGRDGGRSHRAMDIMAPRGTPVLAADSGRVMRVSTNALGGNTIYASDPQGKVVYYYAHLDHYQQGLAAGQLIARGDTLGFVGTTGNAPKDTPHLHFQVMRMRTDGKYWDGEPINPYPLLILTRDVARQ